MDEASPQNGNGFTNKEMWVRVDGKLDVVIAKQNHYDVELALIKARVEEQDRDLRRGIEKMDAEVKERAEVTAAWHDEVRGEIATVRKEQLSISSRQKATAIVVAAIVIVANIIAPVVLRHL